MGQLLMRGMLAGLLAALLAFSFAKVYGEPQVDRAITFEEHQHSHSGNAEEPELVSREVQASIGLFTGVVVFGTGTDAVQAALDGNAVALAELTVVAGDIAEGRLVRPFELGITVGRDFAYYLVYPARNADDPRIVAFRDWLLAEAAGTQT